MDYGGGVSVVVFYCLAVAVGVVGGGDLLLGVAGSGGVGSDGGGGGGNGDGRGLGEVGGS